MSIIATLQHYFFLLFHYRNLRKNSPHTNLDSQCEHSASRPLENPNNFTTVILSLTFLQVESVQVFGEKEAVGESQE
jgi:hypothetical protein